MEKNDIVMVVYDESGKSFPFLSTSELNINDKVIVENESTLFLGRVIGFSKNKFDEKPNMIIRVANEEDLKKFTTNCHKAKEVLKIAKEKAKNYGLEMKLIKALYSLDSSKIILIFSSESRVDFREFVKNLANTFKVRIELKQIGNRDETKIIGGLGVCGKMCCCKEFLPDFAKVSIKMAKNQNLSLNPQKINGLCGRLMCCLSYENESYYKVMTKMPKQHSEVITKDGKGVAIYNDVLREKVSVKIQTKDGGFIINDYDLNDVKVSVYAIKD